MFAENGFGRAKQTNKEYPRLTLMQVYSTGKELTITGTVYLLFV